ncbi:acylphosphatase [Dehalogenimonas lykanthroporepellens BL-DC-9]|nr:acylphosphatase [Dehalogenimonas lykanthroporepellens BL-DC-9]
MNTAVKAIVQGRVQGVGFRLFAAREASRLGVTGYAANLPDGSVEIIAEGTEEAVAAFLTAMKQGPPMARVDRLRTTTVPPTGGHDDFKTI